MKKYFFPLLMAACIPAGAQTDSAIAVVHYTFTHINDTTQPERPLTTKMMLYLGNNMSRYTIERPLGAKGTVSMSDMPMESVKTISVVNGNVMVNGNMLIKEYSYNNSIYKEPATSQMILAVMPPGGSKLFAVMDKAPEINWSIGSETKNIKGMQCQQATARFRGRDYEAWFTNAVPYSNGPWKLGGLPGLIVEAYDTKREVVFSFESFENVQGKGVIIDLPDNAIKTTPKEYKQFEEAVRKDATASRGSAGGMTGMTTMTVAPGATSGRPVKPKQNNNPIEKQ